MVTSHRSGGRLGNWLFQCAALAAHAWRNNVEFGVAEHPDYSKCFPKIPSIPESYRVTNFYHEPSAGYTPIHFEDGQCLVGYFQSWRFYDDYLEQIRDLFDFKPAYFNTEWCSIHVRRGDYLTYPDKHPVIGREYLEPAMKYMAEHGHTRFLVFGDDYDWNQKNVNKEQYPDYVFGYSDVQDPYSDLCAMISCPNNIICNSTYSIWAAELNRNPDKIVVSPHEDNYYGPSHKGQDVKDLLRPSFVKIKY